VFINSRKILPLYFRIMSFNAVFKLERLSFSKRGSWQFNNYPISLNIKLILLDLLSVIVKLFFFNFDCIFVFD